MQAQDIEAYLADLGQELAEMRLPQPVRILLIEADTTVQQAYDKRYGCFTKGY